MQSQIRTSQIHELSPLSHQLSLRILTSQNKIPNMLSTIQVVIVQLSQQSPLRRLRR